MEADIASQAVGLGANTDFSLMSLIFKSRYNCQISNDYFNSLFNLFMGSNY